MEAEERRILVKAGKAEQLAGPPKPQPQLVLSDTETDEDQEEECQPLANEGADQGQLEVRPCNVCLYKYRYGSCLENKKLRK